MTPGKSLPDRILRRLRLGPPGRVFTLDDIHDLGSPQATRMALSRLVKARRVRRVARGFYDLPVRHPDLGELSARSEEIVKALATRHRVRVQPTGALAAHMLGLTDQVPVREAYLTDGTSRRIRVGRREILLRHTSPRYLAASGRTSGLVIQALRWLGKEHVTEETASHLGRLLTREDRRRLAQDARLAPAWVARWMRIIAEEGGT